MPAEPGSQLSSAGLSWAALFGITGGLTHPLGRILTLAEGSSESQESDAGLFDSFS